MHDYDPVPGFEEIQAEFHEALVSGAVFEGRDWTRFPMRMQSLPTVAEIIDAVSKVSGIHPDHIVGPRMDARFVPARHVAMLICHELLDMSLSALGAQFKKERTAVRYGARKARQVIDGKGAGSSLYSGIYTRALKELRYA